MIPATQAPAASSQRADRVLVAENLWYAYTGGAPVLQGVSFSVQPGSIMMMLGRSGSGKTTLIRLLKGLISPQQGHVKVSAYAGNGHPPAVAYIPQSLGLVRSLSALDNTIIGALGQLGTIRSLLKAFPPSIVAKAKGLLGELGLGDKQDEWVARLSGGERQRVAIARALMMSPTLVLADEFVSQLDAVTTAELLEFARGMARQGTSFVISTHETEHVTDYADQLLILGRGKAVYQGAASGVAGDVMLELLA